MTTRYDYDALEKEYVEGDLSVRALAEKHGISAWSTVNAQKNKRHWDEKRQAFRSQVSTRQIELAADRKAKLVQRIEEDFLTVLHAAVLKLGIDLRDRKVKDYDMAAHKEIERVIPGLGSVSVPSRSK